MKSIEGNLPSLDVSKNAANEVFSYFNEIVTESINLETLLHLYQNRSKALLGHVSQAYKRGMIWLNMIIEQIATSTQQNAGVVRLALYRAYFTGDYSILKTFHQAFGRDALRRLGVPAVPHVWDLLRVRCVRNVRVGGEESGGVTRSGIPLAARFPPGCGRA